MIRAYKLYRTVVLAVAMILLLGATGALGAPGEISDRIASARQAGLSETTLSRLVTLSYERQVNASDLAAFIEYLIHLHRDHIPYEPFASKMIEGMTKRVPVSLIWEVVRKKEEDYRFTQRLLSEKFPHEEGQTSPADEYLVRLAESLSCGLSREDLRLFVEDSKPTPLSMMVRGVEINASLRQLDFELDLARQVIATAAQQGILTPEWYKFPRIVLEARNKGVSDDEIAQVTLGVIQLKGSLGTAAAHLGVVIPSDGGIGPIGTGTGWQIDTGSGGRTPGPGPDGAEKGGISPVGPGTGWQGDAGPWGTSSGPGPGGSEDGGMGPVVPGTGWQGDAGPWGTTPGPGPGGSEDGGIGPVGRGTGWQTDTGPGGITPGFVPGGSEGGGVGPVGPGTGWLRDAGSGGTTPGSRPSGVEYGGIGPVGPGTGLQTDTGSSVTTPGPGPGGVEDGNIRPASPGTGLQTDTGSGGTTSGSGTGGIGGADGGKTGGGGPGAARR